MRRIWAMVNDAGRAPSPSYSYASISSVFSAASATLDRWRKIGLENKYWSRNVREKELRREELGGHCEKR